MTLPSSSLNGRLLVVLCALLLSAVVVFAAGGAAPADSGAVATSTDVVLLAAYISLALFFSFLCSVAEAVLLSITPSFIAGLEQERPKQAALIRKLKQENVDRSLAAILTLNTIAHTVGAIGSGAKAAVVFGSEWFGVFSAVMTLMILFLSEIIPKTLGALYWRKLAGVTALGVRGLIGVLYPLIWVSEGLTRFLTRGKKVHGFNRDEFLALATIGAASGHIEPDESRIIHNLMKLDELKARDIMTPRTVIVGLEASATVSQSMATASLHPLSRLPVFQQNLDHVHGFVLRDDLLLRKATDQGETSLQELTREIKTVPPIMPISNLLELFLEQRAHIAMVVDEYGGTMGLVTLEDVVETLLGTEIMDEADRFADMQAMARKQWNRRARQLGLDVADEEPKEE